MSTAIGAAVSSQAQIANGIKTTPPPAQQIVEAKDKFDETPTNGTERLQARNDARAEAREERNRPSEDIKYTASAVTTGIGSRGGNVDISV